MTDTEPLFTLYITKISQGNKTILYHTTLFYKCKFDSASIERVQENSFKPTLRNVSRCRVYVGFALYHIYSFVVRWPILFWVR